jgi:hypothetical protein
MYGHACCIHSTPDILVLMFFVQYTLVEFGCDVLYLLELLHVLPVYFLQ